jgi:hypothetical protein
MGFLFLSVARIVAQTFENWVFSQFGAWKYVKNFLLIFCVRKSSW